MEMIRYFNPASADAVKAVGGRYVTGNSHASLSSQLKTGESLAVFLDRYIFKQIADVTDPREFELFNKQVRQGSVLLLGYFAVPSQRFE